MGRLTDAELAELRADHEDFGGVCLHCTYAEDERILFPCRTACLLAELDRREANPPRWQGSDHRSPAAGLAGMMESGE